MEPVRWEDVPREKLAEGVERQVVWGERGTLARFTFAKGIHVSPHKHEAEQHTCLLEGTMRVRVEGRDIELRAGQVLVLPPWAEHEVWFLEDCVVLDFFAPPREDWKRGSHAYLQGR